MKVAVGGEQVIMLVAAIGRVDDRAKDSKQPLVCDGTGQQFLQSLVVDACVVLRDVDLADVERLGAGSKERLHAASGMVGSSTGAAGIAVPNEVTLVYRVQVSMQGMVD